MKIWFCAVLMFSIGVGIIQDNELASSVMVCGGLVLIILAILPNPDFTAFVCSGDEEMTEH